MTVYLGNKRILINENTKAISPQGNEPAHEKIGNLYSQAICALKTGNLDQIDPLLLKNLGVDPRDNEATIEMCNLLTQLDDSYLQVSPLASGIFLLKKKDPTTPNNEYKEVAVFKIGRKRAAMESSARYLANLLGLNKHMISGMYCTMLNLPVYQLVEKEETTEDLWNGNQKVYEKNKPTQILLGKTNEYNLFEIEAEEINTPNESASSDFTRSSVETTGPSKNASSDFTRTSEEEKSAEKSTNTTTSFDSEGETPVKKALLSTNQSNYSTSFDNEEEFAPSTDVISKEAVFSTACAVVGIVQPFLVEKEEADVFEFTLMTITALAIGLRDGKNDGFKGSMLFDIEDNFPIRIDPIYNSIGHMSTSCAIDLPYLDKDERTKQKLNNEQVDALHKLVSKWDLFDIMKQMGKLEILYTDTACEKMSIGTSANDEGNYEVTIIEGVNHEVNGRHNALINNPKHRILGKEQLNATNTRLGRIRDFIVKHALEKTTFSPEELVDAVDIAGKIYKERLEVEAKTISLSTQCTLTGSGPHHITGRISPTKINLQSPIMEKDVNKKTRKALEAETNPFPVFLTNPLTLPISIPQRRSPKQSVENLLGISISPIEGILNLSVFTGSESTDRFVNSPNENDLSLFCENSNISPIGSLFDSPILLSDESGDENNFFE